MHVIYLCKDHFQACLDFRRHVVESKKVGQNIRGELSLSSGCGLRQRETNCLAKGFWVFFCTDSLATIYISTARLIGATCICTNKTGLPLLFKILLLISYYCLYCLNVLSSNKMTMYNTKSDISYENINLCSSP